ncbi:fibrillin-2-like isoform X48, partial [Paramuricea clavata]
HISHSTIDADWLTFLPQNIDECNEGTHNCGSNARCVNEPQSFSCHCDQGFSGNGIVCQDVDECALQTDNCHFNAECINTNGSYVCFCKMGYFWDGVNCTNNNECNEGSHNCHGNATCEDNDGSFNCTCKPGYSGNGTDCEDIDECIKDEDNNCSPNAVCNNKIGTHECVCKAGYRGNGTHCDDIDECTDLTPPLRCRGVGQGCTNYPGGYRCNCISPGQQLTDDESGCVDVMAAVQGQILITNQVFLADYNDPRSAAYFQITQVIIIQLTGLFRRTATLRSKFLSITILGLFQGSVGVDYVVTFNDTSGVNNEIIQEELVGALNTTNNDTFPGGLQISSDLTFQDYDECNPTGSNPTPVCGHNATCVNRNISYDCVCDEGFVNNGTSCIRCSDGGHGCHEHASCNETEGSFVCTCNAGYSGDGISCEVLQFR